MGGGGGGKIDLRKGDPTLYKTLIAAFAVVVRMYVCVCVN